MFSPEELARYNRHIIIPRFGIEAQQKLRDAKVLVVGSGGLGSPVLLYLAAAGVGTIGIVDFDVVDDSNLQRQVLFGIESVGQSKVEAAQKRLLSLNPHISIKIYNTYLSASNAAEIIKDYDVVADGTDNFPTRYLVNDACVLLGKTNVFASIFRYDGQVSVFNYPDKNGDRGPNYRDLYPDPPAPDLVPSCAEGGVLGVLPGIIGSMQALEVIKVITGIGDVLSGRFFLFDAKTFETRTMSFSKRDDNPLTGKNPTITTLVDYEKYCGFKIQGDDLTGRNEAGIIEAGSIEASSITAAVKEISVQQLKLLKESGADFQLIDVREPHEYEIVNLGAELIPLAQIADHASRIDKTKKVVIHCKSGSRSSKAIKVLEEKFGFTNLYNLEGGIMKYVEEIEQGWRKY
jgi:sulfur-carrier protein adenylyltransferase/sulfurtransferase